MRGARRFLALLLILALLSPTLISCGEEEKMTTATEETETGLSDEEAVAEYLRKLREGEYASDRLYEYEDLSVYFQIADYKGLTYPKDDLISETVTDAFLEDYIVQILLTNVVTDADYTQITEGKVERYDVLTIDYKGYVEGEYDESASAEAQSLLIGSHSYIDGFEDGLLGVAVGETAVLNLKFSPYYAVGKSDVAGKNVRFEVTVKAISRPKIPELTVETINKVFSTEYANLEDFRTDMRLLKNSEKKATAFDYVAAYLEHRILAESKLISLPQKELEYYRNHYLNYYTGHCPTGTSLEDFCTMYLGISYEELKKIADDYATSSVKSDLYCYSVAKKEKIEYTEEQLKAVVEGYYNNSNGVYSSMEAFLNDYIAIYGPYYFVNELMRATVADWIYSNATLAE